MARKARKSKQVQVRVRLPDLLAAALDEHVSTRRGKSRSNASSRSAVVTELLRGMIEQLRTRQGDFGKMLIAEAVREAAETLHYTTVADVRKRLKAVPGTILDSTLLALEKEGVFQLAPSYNGNVLTPEERASGIVDKRRGNLVYAVTDLSPYYSAGRSVRTKVQRNDVR